MRFKCLNFGVCVLFFYQNTNFTEANRDSFYRTQVKKKLIPNWCHDCAKKWKRKHDFFHSFFMYGNTYLKLLFLVSLFRKHGLKKMFLVSLFPKQEPQKCVSCFLVSETHDIIFVSCFLVSEQLMKSGVSCFLFRNRNRETWSNCFETNVSCRSLVSSN